MNFSGKQSKDGFDFLGIGKYFIGISLIVIAGSLINIYINGFNYGIDFAGGTEVQIQFEGQPVTTEKVREFSTSLGYPDANVQKIGDEGSEYLIRIESVEGKTDEETAQAMDALTEKLNSSMASFFEGSQANIRRIDSVGPQVGNELKKNSVLAMFYSLLLILVYIGLRFDYKYAPGAVFCLFHDAIVVLGIFSVFRYEVNMQTLAAVLTIIGYSLNDTIVIFDRIRENEKLFRDKSFYWVCNKSINDTLSRTLLTAFSTMLAVVPMYLFAGGVIKDFSFTLGLGIIFGCYSTVYVATPLVIVFDRLQRGQREKVRATA